MLHNLENAPGAKQARKRLGRGQGSTLGKTSGRGHKGAHARSGSKSRIGFEGGQMPLHIRLPKRGFSNHLFKKEFLTVNVGAIEACEALDKSKPIDKAALQVAGLVPRKDQPLKVLGTGDVKSKLKISADAFSASAKEKIEKAGGKPTLTSAGE